MSIIAYTNARIIDPANNLDFEGTLVTDDDTIKSISADALIPEGAEVIDCGGRILAPGFIDMRAHKVDGQAAAAGGFTSVILQPKQTTSIDNDAAVERILARAKNADVRVMPMGAATKSFSGAEIAEIGQMQETGAVAFTDVTKPVADAQVMRRLLEYAGYFGALIVQFPEEPSLGSGGVAHEGAIATRLGLAGIPAEAEAIQIERDAQLAKMTGTPIHFALISSRVGLNAVKAAKDKGIPVTCGTAPHYLHLNDNALEGYRTFAKVSPPLRSEEDRLALINGLADGTIDVLVSDHKPANSDLKRLPFAQAADGVVGQETTLSVALSHVHAGKISMSQLIKALTATPAKLLGLDTGVLSEGAPADITIFDPNKPWRVDADAMKASAKNTPFDTLPVQGKIWKTIVAGKCIYSEG